MRASALLLALALGLRCEHLLNQRACTGLLHACRPGSHPTPSPHPCLAACSRSPAPPSCATTGPANFASCCQRKFLEGRYDATCPQGDRRRLLADEPQPPNDEPGSVADPGAPLTAMRGDTCASLNPRYSRRCCWQKRAQHVYDRSCPRYGRRMLADPPADPEPPAPEDAPANEPTTPSGDPIPSGDTITDPHMTGTSCNSVGTQAFDDCCRCGHSTGARPAHPSPATGAPVGQGLPPARGDRLPHRLRFRCLLPAPPSGPGLLVGAPSPAPQLRRPLPLRLPPLVPLLRPQDAHGGRLGPHLPRLAHLRPTAAPRTAVPLGRPAPHHRVRLA